MLGPLCYRIGVRASSTAKVFPYLDHLEVVLSRAALRTGPVHRHVLPARARRNALIGQPRRLVVDEAADEAHPGLELHFVFGHRKRGSRMGRILNYVSFASARAYLRGVGSY